MSVCTRECVWKYIFVIFTQRFVGFLRRCLFLPLGFRFGIVFRVSSLGFWFGYFKGWGRGVSREVRHGVCSSSLISFCELVCLFIVLVVVVFVGQRNHILLLSKFSGSR